MVSDWPIIENGIEPPAVLILVLMEYGLWHGEKFTVKFSDGES